MAQDAVVAVVAASGRGGRHTVRRPDGRQPEGRAAAMSRGVPGEATDSRPPHRRSAPGAGAGRAVGGWGRLQQGDPSIPVPPSPPSPPPSLEGCTGGSDRPPPASPPICTWSGRGPSGRRQRPPAARWPLHPRPPISPQSPTLPLWGVPGEATAVTHCLTADLHLERAWAERAEAEAACSKVTPPPLPPHLTPAPPPRRGVPGEETDRRPPHGLESAWIS